jgi:hypothetical protein
MYAGRMGTSPYALVKPRLCRDILTGGSPYVAFKLITRNLRLRPLEQDGTITCTNAVRNL